MIQTAWRKFIQADGDVTALIGTGADSTHPFRWYPAMIPQHASLPAVRFRCDQQVDEDTRDQSGEYVLCRTTIQCQIVGTDYDQCWELMAAIRRVVRKWHRDKANKPEGAMAGVPVCYLTIADGPSDDFEPPADAGKQGFHYVDFSLEITHREED